MYCPNCGKKVKEESDFCLNCGKMLKETITPHKNINGLSVAGLTIAAISSLIIFSCMGTPLEIKEEILYSKGTYEFVLSAVSNIFFYLILPIISLIRGNINNLLYIFTYLRII